MNKSQLEQCIEEYGKEVYAFCRHMTRNVPEAEELFQDTFLKAMELLDKIEYEQNPKSFLISVALRLWKNKKRKDAWRMRIAAAEEFCEGVTELPDVEHIPEEEVIRMEINQHQQKVEARQSFIRYESKH